MQQVEYVPSKHDGQQRFGVTQLPAPGRQAENVNSKTIDQTTVDGATTQEGPKKDGTKSPAVESRISMVVGSLSDTENGGRGKMMIS